MEQNKFETEIKNQLNFREIQPSAQAWDRLDAMLSIAEKSKKKFPWLFIAASFIGFMFVGTIIFKLNSISSSPVQIPKTTIQTPNVVVSSNTVEVQNHNSKTPNVVTTSTKVEKQSKINSDANKVLIIAQNTIKTSIINHQSTTKNHQLSTKEGVSINNQNQIAVNQKQEIANQTIVNQTTIIQQASTKNVDEILALVKPKVVSTTSLKVNPASLLLQVDGEVTTEFRENVFTKVSKNFQTVKVALAERNNTK
jgi:hypothetical protein